MLQRSFSAEPRPPSRVKRRLRRLLEMSPAEIAHRAAERLRIEADRRQHTSRAVALPAGEESFRSYLNGLAGTAFLHAPAGGHYGAIREWLQCHRPDLLDALRREADDALAHRLELLGFGVVDLGPSIDWHRDPVAGERWAVRFFADYDLVHGDGPDPKVCHELSRHGHLPRLAAAYALFGEESYARECVGQMLSWIDQNPVRRGIHWQSSLEIALRVLAWMPALLLLRASAALSEEGARRIILSLVEQITHVDRYPSTYTSPNTHLIGEAAALFVAGCFWRGLAGAEGWQATGAAILEREAARQVGRDGVYGEPSTYYHAYALDFYLLASAAAHRAGHPLADRVRGTVERMAAALAAVSGADGTLPLVGDDDGGALFSLAGAHYGNVHDLLSGAALATERPDLLREGGVLRALWLFGPPTVDAMARSSRAHSSAALPVSFPDAGVYTQSMATPHGSARLVFDAGGMGIGAGGHAHADALQLLWSVEGRPILVDPGTSVYNRAPEWRAYFRGTGAHNTVTVDGTDQSLPWGTFSWGPVARVTAQEPLTRAWCQYAGGAHDGYLRLPGRIQHRRHVVAVGADYWLIVDVLDGSGRHRGAWTYHFAPGLDVSVGECETVVRARARAAEVQATLAVVTSAPSIARCLAGQLDPIQGWVSGRYGERRPAPVLEVAAEAELPLVAVTVLSPRAEAPAIDVFLREGGRLSLGITAGDAVDEVTVSSRSKDDLVWRRRRNGDVMHRLAAGARGALLVER
jgi:uncharacterized heparinase superfamily protein